MMCEGGKIDWACHANDAGAHLCQIAKDGVADRDCDSRGGLRLFESIPLWAVTLIGGLFITVLSFIMIMSVYGRFSSCTFIPQSLPSLFLLCGRAEPECRQELYQELLCRVP